MISSSRIPMAPDSFEIHFSDGVASFFDKPQNEAVRLLTYLDIEAEHENDNNGNYQRPSPPQSSSSPSTSDVEESTNFGRIPLHAEPTTNSTEQRTSTK